jgi:hypothetical protein
MSTTHTDIYLEGVPDVLAEKCDRLCSLTDKIEKLEVDASGHLRGAAGGCITDDAESAANTHTRTAVCCVAQTKTEFSGLGTAELPEQRESRPFRGRRHRAG